MSKLLRAVFAAVVLATTLAGCIVVPVGGGHGPYHHRGGYHDRY